MMDCDLDAIDGSGSTHIHRINLPSSTVSDLAQVTKMSRAGFHHGFARIHLDLGSFDSDCLARSTSDINKALVPMKECTVPNHTGGSFILSQNHLH